MLLKLTLVKILAFLAGLVFGAFPPELIAILITPNPGAGGGSSTPHPDVQGAARLVLASRRPGRRRRRIYRNPRRRSR